MCHFISLILPANADEDAVRRLAISAGRRLELVENPHVAQQLEAGERQFITANGACDCGTPIGSALRETDDDRDDHGQLERHIAGLKSQGWSEVKIDRWLSQRQAMHQRKERINRDRLRDGVRGFRPQIDDWIGLLRQIVTTGASPHVGLLLHNYHGKIDNERIALQGIEIVRARELTAEALLRTAEDFVYVFRP